MGALGRSEEQSNYETTHDIYHKSTQREGAYHEQVAQLSRQKSHTSADKTSEAGNNHCFNHSVKVKFFLFNGKSRAALATKHGTLFVS